MVLLGSETEGTNRLDVKDVTGYEMVKDFIRGAVAEGSYFCDYLYPKICADIRLFLLQNPLINGPHTAD